MAVLRLLTLMTLALPTVLTAHAQETEADGHFIDRLIEIDSTTTCDEVGLATMPDEFAANTVDTTRQPACHRGVGGMLLAGCVEPYVYLGPEYEGGPPGVAHIFCMVGVINTGVPVLVVDPNDFSISGDYAETIPPDPSLIKTLDAYALKRTELRNEMQTVSGPLTFSVPESISRPFVLMWWPDSPTDKDPVGVIIDRTVPWEDAQDVLTSFGHGTHG